MPPKHVLSTEKNPFRSRLGFDDVALHQASCRTQDLILKLNASHSFVTVDGNHGYGILFYSAVSYVLKAIPIREPSPEIRILKQTSVCFQMNYVRNVSILPVLDGSNYHRASDTDSALKCQK